MGEGTAGRDALVDALRIHGVPNAPGVAQLAEAVFAQRTEDLTRERDLAIAHDRQPYPTAWAYEQVCRVEREQRARAERAEAERDELRRKLAAKEDT